MIHRIKTIDSHTAGEPLRLVIDGLPAPEGRTMLEKRAWAQKRLDHLRKSIMLEPRGHTDMYGALLTEPVTRDGHAGILFMHNEGWSTMCGHGIIAVSTQGPPGRNCSRNLEWVFDALIAASEAPAARCAWVVFLAMAV